MEQIILLHFSVGVTDVLIAVKRKEQILIKTCLAIKFGRARKK